MRFLGAIVGLLLLHTAVAAYSAAENADYDPNIEDSSETNVQNDVQDYDDDADEEEDDTTSDYRIETQPQPFSAEQNDTVELPCHFNGPDGFAIGWKKDGVMLYQDSIPFGNSNPRYSVLAEGKNHTLLISNVTTEDDGEYTCDVIGRNISITHRLHVKSAPFNVTVRAEGKGAELKAGDQLVLNCTAKGYPAPTIKWYKGDGSVALGMQGNLLVIPSVKHGDAGTYRCFADNGVNPPAHEVITVDVEYEPRIRTEKNFLINEESFSADLRCTVHAHPAATVTWQKDGRNVIRTENRLLEIDNNDHILKIKEVRDSDLGTYVCLAKNHVGESTGSIKLMAEPVVLDFVPPKKETGRNATFMWKIESIEPLQEVEVRYRKKGSEEEWRTETEELETVREESNIYTFSKTVSGLEAGKYVVQARSKNKNGYSDWSEEFSFERANKKHDHKQHKENKNHKKHNEAQQKQTQESQSNTERSSPSSSTQINIERTSQSNTEKILLKSNTERTSTEDYYITRKTTVARKPDIIAKFGGLEESAGSTLVPALSLVLVTVALLLHRC